MFFIFLSFIDPSIYLKTNIANSRLCFRLEQAWNQRKKKKKMPPVRQDTLDEKKTEHDRVVGQMGEGEGFDLQKPLTSGVSLSFSRDQHLLSPDEYFAYRTPSCNRVSKK